MHVERGEQKSREVPSEKIENLMKSNDFSKDDFVYTVGRFNDQRKEKSGKELLSQSSLKDFQRRMQEDFSLNDLLEWAGTNEERLMVVERMGNGLFSKGEKKNDQERLILGKVVRTVAGMRLSKEGRVSAKKEMYDRKYKDDLLEKHFGSIPARVLEEIKSLESDNEVTVGWDEDKLEGFVESDDLLVGKEGENTEVKKETVEVEVREEEKKPQEVQVEASSENVLPDDKESWQKALKKFQAEGNVDLVKATWKEMRRRGFFDKNK
jgi:hypothetical protein